MLRKDLLNRNVPRLEYDQRLASTFGQLLGAAPGMATKAEHTVIVEQLGNDRFALMIDGLVRFVSYDFDACMQRAETILRSQMSTKTKDNQTLPSAIERL